MEGSQLVVPVAVVSVQGLEPLVELSVLGVDLRRLQRRS